MVEDLIEATEVLHDGDGADLHFRFIGKAKNRQLLVNIQFASENEETGERLRPEEYDFMIVKALSLIVAHVRSRANPALH
jgi:hypothetical protein